jgi:hypothetical protein
MSWGVVVAFGAGMIVASVVLCAVILAYSQPPRPLKFEILPPCVDHMARGYTL